MGSGYPGKECRLSKQTKKEGGRAGEEVGGWRVTEEERENCSSALAEA